MGRTVNPYAETLLVSLVLVVFVFQAQFPAHTRSTLVDEGEHLTAGRTYWNTCSFSEYNVNPPLSKLLYSIPFRMLRDASDSRPQDSLAEKHSKLAFANGTSYTSVVFACRCMVLAVACGTAVLVYMALRKDTNRFLAMMGLLLWCQIPDVLFWSTTCTADSAAALIALLLAFQLRGFWEHPSGMRLVLLSAGLGAALLTKFTLMLFVPLVLSTIAIRIWFVDGQQEIRRRLFHACFYVGAVSGGVLLVVNAGYVFEGSFRPLGSYKFASSLLSGASQQMPLIERLKQREASLQTNNRFANTFLAKLPVPFPEEFVLGFDKQKFREDASLGLPTYLLSHWYAEGTVFFYLYAWALKLPLGIQLVGIVTTVVVAVRRKLEPRIFCFYVVPAILLFGTISVHKGMGVYSATRYVLPALPLLLVALMIELHRGIQSVRILHYPWFVFLPGCFLVCALESLAVRHDPLSYINVVYSNWLDRTDHRIPPLIEGNYDWGQDVLRLVDWQRSLPPDTKLGLFARVGVDPRVYGLVLADTPLPLAPKSDRLQDRITAGSHVYVIGVSQLAGMKADAYIGGKYATPLRHMELAQFQSLTPCARIGRTYWVFAFEGDLSRD